jgi:hypothetical protein
MAHDDEDLMTVAEVAKQAVTGIVNSVGERGLLVVVGIVVKGDPMALEIGISPQLRVDPADNELGNAITEAVVKFMNRHAKPIIVTA